MTSCSVCSNLQPESLKVLQKGQRAILFVNLGDIRDSVSQPSPCPECSLVWNALNLYKSNWVGTRFDRYVELVIAYGKPVRLNWHDDSIQLELFSGFRNNDQDKNSVIPTDVLGLANRVSANSAAPSCFQLVSSWFKTCLDSHSSCVPRGSTLLPTRLLDVGSSDGTHPYLANTGGQHGQYTALSYCWGDQSHFSLKTTAQTLKENQAGINFNSLSKTLQDAVTLTRYLGVQYIWIDALCIVQGDADDWARESSNMSNIYLNAVLTISADNSPGSHQGIFNSQGYGVAPQQVPYKNGRSVLIRRAFAQEHDPYAATIRAGVNPEPTSCRAWTLQEAILSNRIVRYTSKELVWDCNEAWYCECGSATGMKSSDDFDERYLRDASAFASLPLERVHEQWEQIVMRLTERSLSVEKDKLPALSGLAKQFATIFQHSSPSHSPGDYLAGLWRSNLVMSLRWAIEDDYYRTAREESLLYARARAYRAPSWSWAALEGPVNYAPTSNFTSSLTVISASTTPSTIDSYGQVSAGELVVRGKLVRGLSVEVLDPADSEPYMGFTARKRFALRYKGRLRTFISDNNDDFGDGQAGVYDLNLACLLLGSVSGAGSGSDHKEVFLVLRHRPSGRTQGTVVDDNVFERVGVSLRAALETSKATWQEEWARCRNGDPEVVRLFDDAPEELVTIV